MGNTDRRIEAIQCVIDQIVTLFANPFRELDNQSGLIGTDLLQTVPSWEIQIQICIKANHHLIDELRLPSIAKLHETKVEAEMLGFVCHQAMADHSDQFDWFCYLEDDIVIHDADFFWKQVWFRQMWGDKVVLQPNRYEVYRHWHKVYVDGPLPAKHVERYCDLSEQPRFKASYAGSEVEFYRSSNPMAGCFVLSQNQLTTWMASDCFDDQDTSFGSPLESAQILGPLKLFRVYKPTLERADFLEVEHADARLISGKTPQQTLQDKISPNLQKMDEP